MAGFLTDYYSGAEGAGSLDFRDRRDMIARGEALRFAPEDIAWLEDRYIRDLVDRQGAVLDIPIQNARGAVSGYNRLDNPNVGPGGTRTISSGEALMRSRASAAGGRALADPAGIGPALERQNYNAKMREAFATADYLSQFMEPERIADEVFRQTGVRLPGGITTPNLDKRYDAAADRRQKEVSAANTAEDAEKKRLEREAAPVIARSNVDSVTEALDDVIKEAKRLREHKGAYLGSGLTGNIAAALPISSEAKDFQIGLNAFKGRIALNTIQALKAASPTGATGFGALSEGELKVLQDSFGALDRAQSYDEVRRVLADIQKVAQRQSQQTERRYQTEFGRRAAPSQRAIEPAAPAPGAGIPPPDQRPPGVYATPRGNLYWTGQGWTQPTSEQVPSQTATPSMPPINPAAAAIQFGAGLVRR
jgi:hypothetical protein